MKLSSVFIKNNLAPGQTIKAEVLASENGKSLVSINGLPTQVNGEFSVGDQLKAVVDDSGNSIILESEITELSTDKHLLIKLGLSPSKDSLELLGFLRKFNVNLNAETLKQALQLLKSLKNSGPEAQKAISLLLQKGIDVSELSKLAKYYSGKLQFREFFSGLDSELKNILRNVFSSKNSIERIFELIKSQKGNFSLNLKQEIAEKMIENFQFQELLSKAASEKQEGVVYFQWPIFWEHDGLPDTLEGEAFIPGNGKEEQGFCIRMLVQPSNLGKIEVAINKMDQVLWVHFGIENLSIEKKIKSIFSILTERLLTQNWKSVRLTAGELRRHHGFFSKIIKKEVKSIPTGIDLKV